MTVHPYTPIPDIPRPPFDPELRAALSLLPSAVTSITPDMIDEVRDARNLVVTAQMLDEAGIASRDVTIRSFDGAELTATVLQARRRTRKGPGIYYVHGGGMVFGNRWTDVSLMFDWIVRHDAIAVTLEYRLAPEYPDPHPLEDVYAGLRWMAEHAEGLGDDPLGFDETRLLIAGGSAGGGLAAGAALLARDRNGPALCGQMLMYPMLDDRSTSVSSRQFDGIGGWDRSSNITGWKSLLGDRYGTDDVSGYTAPARMADLRDLPPAFIDCGSAEIFRDEDIAYASAIWAAGGQAELHVWPGGFHGFETYVPQAALSQAMLRARTNWVDRILSR